MLNKRLRKILHKIALNNNLSDSVAEKIVKSPFEFQAEKLKEGNTEGKVNFYHKYIGKFFIKEKVLRKLKKVNGDTR